MVAWQTLKNENNERRQKLSESTSGFCMLRVQRFLRGGLPRRVEHVKVRSTKSKTGKPRLLNTEPLPGGGGGWTREESSLRPGRGGGV